MSRTEALNQVKMYQANDWEVVNEYPEYFLLKKNTATTAGHLVILILFWWTFGLFNLIYWAMSNQSKRIIK